ncbi:type II toxin-antitoxin system Phd/YefM family antitoxin [Candidatus Zixiibacteriota bacterium]
MLRIAASDARKGFADLINRTGYAGERVILEKHGREIAAVVPIVDLIMLELLENQLDIVDTRISITEALKDGATSLDDLRAELGLG